jgi:hypothetical protein
MRVVSRTFFGKATHRVPVSAPTVSAPLPALIPAYASLSLPGAARLGMSGKDHDDWPRFIADFRGPKNN